MKNIHEYVRLAFSEVEMHDRQYVLHMPSHGDGTPTECMVCGETLTDDTILGDCKGTYTDKA